MQLLFVETTLFTRRIAALGLEPALKALQERLLERPTAGALEPGTGGLRKIRMPDPARGKGLRSGARVHYLHVASHGVLYLLFVYGKDDQDGLTPTQRRVLKGMSEAIVNAWTGPLSRD